MTALAPTLQAFFSTRLTSQYGASLEEVGQLLRHAGTATTLIYATTDQRRLAGLARRWPTGGHVA